MSRINLINDTNLIIDKNVKLLLPHQFYYPQIRTIADRSNDIKESNFLNSLKRDNHLNEAMIYIHIPFCDSKCTFCSFDKIYDLDKIESYINSIYDEIDYYSNLPYIKSLKILSVHFGGGTPTLLPSNIFRLLIHKIKNAFNCQSSVINIESSANTIHNIEMIEMIKEMHVSRVSVGVQSFNPKIRSFYDANSSLSDVYLALERLKNNNIITYIDIMYGYPKINDVNEYDRVIFDIDEARRLGVEGIEFGQLFPKYNKMEKDVSDDSLNFMCKDELITLLMDSSRRMVKYGYIQKTEYAFIKSNENIILENAYYGGNSKAIDCLAIGCSSFGYLNGWKYRNHLFSRYMKNDPGSYLHLKKLSDYETEMMGIAGFPKLLRINKSIIEKAVHNKSIIEKINVLLSENLIYEDDTAYALTEIGKSYIDNIYYFLLSNDEKKYLLNDVKIHYN